MIQKAKNYYQTKKDRVSIIEIFLKMRKKRKLRNYAKNKTKNMSDEDTEKKLLS